MAQPSIFTRLPKQLHSEFMKLCKEHRRSMTAQLEVIVKEWVAAQKGKPG